MIVYDIETYPNVFTLSAVSMHDDTSASWIVADWQDDRAQILAWFDYLHKNRIHMIGFNNEHFDYPVVHHLWKNPNATARELYDKAMSIIDGDKFAHTVWPRDRFAPQIDLFKIHHFDNRAKTTSLKALEINMRSPNVIDLPFEVGTPLTEQQARDTLIPYNMHDVRETKRFAGYSMTAIEFRMGMIETLGEAVLNYNDTKIGEKLLELRIGDICYERDVDTGRRKPRQTHRDLINLSEIIFPYISFKNSEFAQVHAWLMAQTLRTDYTGVLQTKDTFEDLRANVGNVMFHFGTGGIHASTFAQRIVSDERRTIVDIDVASLYPSIAIVNRLAPAHLGEAFTTHYSALRDERKHWQRTKGKKSIEANSIKLALNGTYGKSNSAYSVFYDPQFTMSITINGQLLLAMLAEWLLTVPSLTLIQCNTDGITYQIEREHVPAAENIQRAWERYTCLTLESVEYRRMWIRDVNNYVAESMDGTLKTKGAYWAPEPGSGYATSITECQPPAWHKALDCPVVARAAVAAMVHSIEAETYIRLCTEPFDFMLRAKVDRASVLMHGTTPIQRTSRYYVSTDGQPLNKMSGPVGMAGAFKRKSGVSEHDYQTVMRETGGAWDERVCTKNKSTYTNRATSINSGFLTTICNNVNDYNFNNVNYDFYINEAKKLIV